VLVAKIRFSTGQNASNTTTSASGWFTSALFTVTSSGIKELATMMDFYPTIANLVDCELPNVVIDGQDIWPLFTDPEKAKTPHAFFAYYQLDQLQAIRTSDWKLYLQNDFHKNMWNLKTKKVEMYRTLKVEVERISTNTNNAIQAASDFIDSKK
jgi:hypothetical protein